MTIKAIETRYKGCRFRSRLEARWAVFFDYLGLAWEYEQQGYVIDDKPFLPDFVLRPANLILEVKPRIDPQWPCRGWMRDLVEDAFQDMLSLMELCNQKKQPGFMLFGSPGRLDYFLWPCALAQQELKPHYWNDLLKADESDLELAFEAARSARFEHGECG